MMSNHGTGFGSDEMSGMCLFSTRSKTYGTKTIVRLHDLVQFIPSLCLLALDPKGLQTSSSSKYNKRCSAYGSTPNRGWSQSNWYHRNHSNSHHPWHVSFPPGV